MLSNKAYKLLAKTLAPKIAGELFASEAWVDFLHENVPALIEKELGEMDEEVLYDLSLCVMDSLYLKTASLPVG